MSMDRVGHIVWKGYDSMYKNITEEEMQVVWSALSCASKEITGSLTVTLVECAKQIVGMHMNSEVEMTIDYNDGLLMTMEANNGKEE